MICYKLCIGSSLNVVERTILALEGKCQKDFSPKTMALNSSNTNLTKLLDTVKTKEYGRNEIVPPDPHSNALCVCVCMGGGGGQ